ncbi:MAG: glycosyltransferase [Chloroflexota bacterium]
MGGGGPTVGVVVINYKRYDLLAACLASLAASTRAPDRVVVIDNATDRAQLAETLAPFPEALPLPDDGNPGYAASCNSGWRAAGTDLVLFLNADVTLRPDCLERVVAALLADHRIGIVTARLLRPDGTTDHACHRGIPTPSAGLWYSLRLHRLRPRSHRFAAYTMSWLDPATDHDVEACSGAFLLMRTETLERLRGWDEGYWFYAEDLDLCLRATQLGLRVRYVADAVAIHVKGASSHLREDDAALDPEERETRARVRAAIVASHRRFFRLHLAEHTARPVRWLVEAQFAWQAWRRRPRPLPPTGRRTSP